MSSPRGRSPSAEQQDPNETPAPNLDDSSTIDDTDATTRALSNDTQEADVDGQQPESPESETVPTHTTATTEDEAHTESITDTDQLASQLNLLGTRLGAYSHSHPGDQDDEAGPSTVAPPAQTAVPPPQSANHLDPLQRTIDLNHSLPPLNHSLPPTPREEHPERELGFPTSRSERRRSTVSFREDAVADQGSASPRSSVVRDYDLERHASFPAGQNTGRRGSQRSSTDARDIDSNEQGEFVLPRWQPDAEVTYCPICQTQFSIFVRKHHCRKCGRVVCNSCSPHRIIIPYQYIVRPPGSEVPLPRGFPYEGLTTSYSLATGPAGGERVRLCNPCVPDPQTAPPQSPGAGMGSSSIRSAHQRSRSSYASNYSSSSSSNRYPGSYAESRGGDQYRRYSAGTRSITMAAAGRAGPSGSTSRMAHHGSLQRLLVPGSSYPVRHSSLAGASSSRNRTLPPTPQIAEEDECPICHRELPSRELPNFEAAREAHITSCIQSHSTYGSPGMPAPEAAGAPGPPPPMRLTGMYKYIATEKDCIDDAECTICLEEFTVGVGMARLECLCRFHRSCISAWFVNHPGRCPVHQHDGFGF